MGKALGNVALVVAAMGIAVLLAEGLLRLTEHRYALESVRFPDGYFVDDPSLGARQAADRSPELFRFAGPSFETFTNSLGCFDYEQVIEPGYVLVIGDSATWGYVPLEENWPTRLGALIGRQVLKCGVVGVGTRYQAAWLEELVGRIGMPPSAVVLLYTSNDLNDDVVYPSYRVVEGQRLDALASLDLATGDLVRHTDAELAEAFAAYKRGRVSIRGWLRRHSIVAWIVYRALFRNREEPTPREIYSRYEVALWQLDDSDRAWLRSARESHVGRLVTLSRRVRELGAAFIVFDHDEGPHNPVLRERLVGEVDFYYQLDFDRAHRPGSRRYFHPYDGHWNVEGTRAAAEEMFLALQSTALFSEGGGGGKAARTARSSQRQ